MEKKMTKRDFYNEIIELATDCERQDIIDFCNHELELLEKKKSNGKAKVNETMDKNIELVYNALVEMNERATATELIAKESANLKPLENDLGVITTQKVSAYLNKLVASGRVAKETEKKKTYFSVVA
jgi:glycine cleavage system aminomethyltransferase T